MKFLKRIKKKVTLIEMVIVMAFLVGIMVFSANMVTNNKMLNPPLLLSTGQNFTKISLHCTDDNLCKTIEYCPLSFTEDYISEVNNTTNIVEGKFSDLNKYVSKTESCRTKEFIGYSLHDFYRSMIENVGSNHMFLINGIFYDKTMKKITGIYDRESGTQIIDGMLYFN